MKIIVSNTKCKIETDNPELLRLLIEKFSASKPGSFYARRSSNYRWNGKTYFVTKAGYFKTGLLYRVFSELQKVCKPQLEFKHPPVSYQKEEFTNIGPFTPYDYQISLVKKALDRKRVIIKSPTGSGKTLMMALLLHNLNINKSLFLFPKKQLVNQTYEFFKSCGIIDLGLNHGEGFIQGSHMLSTVQSLGKIADTVLDSQLLVVDEAHEFSGDNRAAILQELDSPQYKVGFTATPPRETYYQLQLEASLGPVIEEVKAIDLVDQGKLSKPIIHLINLPEVDPQLHFNNDYPTNYTKYIIKNDSRNKRITQIIDFIRTKRENPKIVVIVKNLEHLSILKELIPNSASIEGKDSLEERYKIINKFISNSGIDVIICTKVLESGVNIEEITHLINARGLKKDIPTLQALGRLLRKSDTKDMVYYYDFLDKVRYLDEHALSRKRHYKREGYEIKEL